ncbi:ATP-binding cassette sub-family C member 2 [Rhipicephalus sanguineus]|uniref:ATP-binding cassette sub-family C member 2 n=1 Tax=Rhipicephalus sanguineus TaxID=34632 RepID=UPI0020C56452|nr:ATP-binding cassette sub-family C member 2 [Rhipicephalus sanguineus]
MEDDTSSPAVGPAVPTTEGSLAEAAGAPVSSNIPPPAPRQPLPSEFDVQGAPTHPPQSSTGPSLPMAYCLQALASQGEADRRALMQDFETRFATRLLSLETALAQRTSTADDVVADLAARVSVIEAQSNRQQRVSTSVEQNNIGRAQSRFFGAHLLPPTFDGTTSWAAFLVQFESIATLNGWTVQDKVQVLVLQLRDAAAEYLEHIPQEARLLSLGPFTEMPTLPVKLGDPPQRVEALVDTGAAFSFLTSSFLFGRFSLNPAQVDRPHLVLADGAALPSLGEVYLNVGLLAGTSYFSFYQSVILLCASCIAECLVSSLQSYFTVQSQLKAQLLLQTAVFKKVTCLSATALAENPAGHVTSLLAADSWLVAVSIYYLPNALMGFVCVPIALVLLGVRMGSVAAFACLLWLVVIASASLSMEPLLDKYCNILYKYRDERLKKLNDFLSVLRMVKMSALEDVFRSRLLQLRLKEIDQAYRVNVVDSLLETLISASTSVMTILAFATVTFMNPEKMYSPATIYSCVYILTLMDIFTSTMTHAARLKSPVFRSCRRLMSFFADEEWNSEAAETLRSPQGVTGQVTLRDCSFAWAKESCSVVAPVLQNVSVNVSSGSIVGIVGSVGSGKSSLLSAVTGDMKRIGGTVALKGTIGVVCQRPHVFNMTIRDNIIFGGNVDESYYWKVLEACQIIRDIERFPAGDMTEAGEKGEMLSGGQKQRVALARALYSKSDIYLLDDATSSQDPRVARNILDRVIGPHGLLGTKTRLFVTNNTWLPFSPDQWVLMHNRTAVLFDDLSELKQHPGAPTELFKEPNGKRVRQVRTEERKKEAKKDSAKQAVAVVREEGLSTNKGLLSISMAYIKHSGAWTVLAFLCFVLSAALTAGQLICIKAWATLKIRESNISRSSQDIIMWLALACIGDVVFRLVGGILLARGTRHFSLSLHDKMIRHVASSPLSFFDATPRGRIMNRFSVDLEMNDSRAFVAIKQLYQTLLAVVARLAIIGTQALIVCILACGAEIVLIFIIRYVINATTLSRQYESTRLSRVLQHLTETLDSVGMIRCYRVMDKFCARYRRLMNDYIEAFNAFILSYSFTRLIVTVFGVLVILLAMVIVVVPSRGDVEAAASNMSGYP